MDTRKRALTLGLCGAAAVAPIAGLAQRSAASTTPEPEPVTAEVLTPRAEFGDDVDLQLTINHEGMDPIVVNVDEPSRSVIVRVTVQPGAQLPWHTHSGPVIQYIVEGELIYVMADDCVEHAYPAGSAFVDPGHGVVHTAFNRGDDVAVVVAAFFEASEDGPLSAPADAPPDCTAAP